MDACYRYFESSHMKNATIMLVKNILPKDYNVSQNIVHIIL